MWRFDFVRGEVKIGLKLIQFHIELDYDIKQERREFLVDGRDGRNLQRKNHSTDRNRTRIKDHIIIIYEWDKWEYFILSFSLHPRGVLKWHNNESQPLTIHYHLTYGNEFLLKSFLEEKWCGWRRRKQINQLNHKKMDHDV